MAQNPQTHLEYVDGCPDCAQRKVDLPPVRPPLGDDFDWDARDFDGLRQLMLEAIAARFPERRRWTAADLEVVLVEVLASQLDKLSDMLDRVAAEFTLETARRPDTIRRLLRLIGYDAVTRAERLRIAPFHVAAVEGDTRTSAERLDQYWLRHPEEMEAARREGPRTIRTQRRMVTTADYQARLEEHPAVRRAHAWEAWTGSWLTIRLAIIPSIPCDIDQPLPPAGTSEAWTTLWKAVSRFHDERLLQPPPALNAKPTLRALLHPYLEAYRMTGQPVELMRAVEVGVVLAVSVEVEANHYQSEVRDAVRQILGTGPGSFFEPGRLRFGEDLWASDIVQAIMAIDGVRNVCINRFKRVGDRFPDSSAAGHLQLDGLEVAICESLAGHPERGYVRLNLHGGQKG